MVMFGRNFADRDDRTATGRRWVRRCGRRIYWLGIGLAAALMVLASVSGGVGRLLEILALTIAGRAALARLHDLDWSGLWLLPFPLAIFGPPLFARHSTVGAVIFGIGLIATPLFLALLGIRRGNPGRNSHGAPEPATNLLVLFGA